MDFAARKRARRAAVQGLYQCALTGEGSHKIELAFVSANTSAALDEEYFNQLIKGVTADQNAIDTLLQPYCDRQIQQVDPVERVILRVACFELCHMPEIPYRVVLNEAVQLAKIFGAEQGYKYINGVLDKLAKQLRPVEQS